MTGRVPIVAPRVAAPEVADWQYENSANFMRVFTPAALADVYEALLAEARAGDMSAIKLVLSDGVGNPPHSPPQEPIEAEPGTDEKVEVMGRRFLCGEPVLNPHDSGRGGRNGALNGHAANGASHRRPAPPGETTAAPTSYPPVPAVRPPPTLSLAARHSE